MKTVAEILGPKLNLNMAVRAGAPMGNHNAAGTHRQGAWFKHAGELSERAAKLENENQGRNDVNSHVDRGHAHRVASSAWEQVAIEATKEGDHESAKSYTARSQSHREQGKRHRDLEQKGRAARQDQPGPWHASDRTAADVLRAKFAAPASSNPRVNEILGIKGTDKVTAGAPVGNKNAAGPHQHPGLSGGEGMKKHRAAKQGENSAAKLAAMYSDMSDKESHTANFLGDSSAHNAAANFHDIAAERHQTAINEGGDSQYHQMQIAYHKDTAERHRQRAAKNEFKSASVHSDSADERAAAHEAMYNKASDRTPSDKVTASAQPETDSAIAKLVAYLAALRFAHWEADTATNEHKTLGDLYEELDGLVDSFTETFMGKAGVVKCEPATITELADPTAEGLAIVTALKSQSEGDDLQNILADMEGALNKAAYLLKATEPAKATDRQGGDAVRATWSQAARDAALEVRRAHGVVAHHHRFDMTTDASNLTHAGLSGRVAVNNGAIALRETEKSEPNHQKAHRFHEQAARDHSTAAKAFDKAGNYTVFKYHSDAAEAHTKLAKMHQEKGALDAKTTASDASTDDAVTARASDVVHCRSASDVLGEIKASDQPWKIGHETRFMWMPAGQHTICAGFRGQSILLTVNIDPERDTQVVQASFQKLVSKYPKQKPFGCIEHEEKDASVWAKGFEAKADGIYLAAEPSALGENHVNGRIHRSWSPSFLTDADYKKAVLQEYPSGKVYEFPAGVRGSEQNPARITGVTFCVGTLTNNPAFKEIDPVRAKEMATTMNIEQDKVTAAEDSQKRSEAAKEGWRNRMLGHLDEAMLGHRETHYAESHKDAMKSAQDSTKAARNAQAIALEVGNKDAHDIASEALSEASEAHMKAMHKAAVEKEHGHRQYHAMMSRHLREESNYHTDLSKRAPTGEKTQATAPRTVDAILAGAKPGNQNAAGPHKHSVSAEADKASEKAHKATQEANMNEARGHHDRAMRENDKAAEEHGKAFEKAKAEGNHEAMEYHSKMDNFHSGSAKAHRGWLSVSASDKKSSVGEILKKSSCNPKP